MILVSSCSCLCPIHWCQVLSREWRCTCSWSSADRRCSNYIWVINNCIAFSGATYIRGLTGSWLQPWCQPTLPGTRGPCAVHVLQYHEISVTLAQVAYWLDYSDVTCAPQCLNSPTTRLFLQQPAIKKTLKVRITGPYMDSTGDRWFLFTRNQ